MLCNGKCEECQSNDPENYEDCKDSRPKLDFKAKDFFNEAEMWQKLNPIYLGKPKFKEGKK